MINKLAKSIEALRTLREQKEYTFLLDDINTTIADATLFMTELQHGMNNHPHRVKKVIEGNLIFRSRGVNFVYKLPAVLIGESGIDRQSELSAERVFVKSLKESDLHSLLRFEHLLLLLENVDDSEFFDWKARFNAQRVRHIYRGAPWLSSSKHSLDQTQIELAVNQAMTTLADIEPASWYPAVMMRKNLKEALHSVLTEKGVDTTPKDVETYLKDNSTSHTSWEAAIRRVKALRPDAWEQNWSE